jgi:hypothetical protein
MRTALLAALALAGCDRGHPRDTPPPPPPSTPVPAPAASATKACTLAPVPLRYRAPRRLVAIGDIHGDLVAARAALRTAGAIDAADKWIGGDLVIVQTGDVLDRGNDEKAIYELLFSLRDQAAAAGGAVILLLGNHELMNAAGDFRYVTRGQDFGDTRPRDLAPGGAYAKKLAGLNVVAIVGDTIFAHGGVLGDWVTQVDEVNRTSRCWLDGQAGGQQAPAPALIADDGPVWTRAAGMPDVDCAPIKAALAKLGVARMVVGHTPQEKGISSRCDDTVWRIDVGMSKAYGGPIEVLELVPGAQPKVLRGTR